MREIKLAGLPALRYVGLHGGSEQAVLDSINLTDLPNLENLDLISWGITDITWLEGLSSLEWLRLRRNALTNIEPLGDIPNLSHLMLESNKVSDISPLSGLTKLDYLDLRDNEVSNIRPLIDNNGLEEGDRVHLEDNPLSDSSRAVYIPMLQERGVNVYY